MQVDAGANGCQGKEAKKGGLPPAAHGDEWPPGGQTVSLQEAQQRVSEKPSQHRTGHGGQGSNTPYESEDVFRGAGKQLEDEHVA